MMTRAQRITLGELNDVFFPGYCEIMLQTGCKSYKAVDWVLDALERKGYITYETGEPLLTAAGIAASQSAA